jgi:hypothetical protein
MVSVGTTNSAGSLEREVKGWERWEMGLEKQEGSGVPQGIELSRSSGGKYLVLSR